MLYAININLQAENLMLGAFLKELLALKRILDKRETKFAQILSHESKNMMSP